MSYKSSHDTTQQHTGHTKKAISIANFILGYHDLIYGKRFSRVELYSIVIISGVYVLNRVLFQPLYISVGSFDCDNNT